MRQGQDTDTSIRFSRSFQRYFLRVFLPFLHPHDHSLAFVGRQQLRELRVSTAVMDETSSEYRGRRLLIFTACFIPVQIFSVALRYLARYLVKGPWGLDDIVVFTSLTFQLCLAGISIGELQAVEHTSLVKCDRLMARRFLRKRGRWLPYPIP